jgi:polysaccharide pyruvyl transferase WcaK-like protein
MDGSPDSVTFQRNRELTVTIVNCLPDHNKGACAMVWGLVSRLRASGLVGKISVISIFRDISHPVAYRHLSERFPDIPIHRSPVFSRAESFGLRAPWVKRKAGTVLHAPYVLGASLEVRVSWMRERLLRREPGARALVNSDLVLNRGGPLFTASGPPPNPTLLSNSWPFLLAREVGVPYAVIGESVGSLGNVWARRFTRSLFAGARLIGIREDLSRKTLTHAGISGERITTMLDNAFWMQPRRSERVDALLRRRGLDGHRFLAVTVRPWPGIGWSYLDELAKAIDLLVPSLFERVALVSNTYNPAGAQRDDRAFTRLLFQRISRKDRVSLIEEDLAPDELASLYGAASLVIGTRLHSVILALVAGAPVVAVSYLGPKTRGTMELLGLSDYVLDMKTFDHRAGAELAEAALTGQADASTRIDQLRCEGDVVLGNLLQEIADDL